MNAAADISPTDFRRRARAVNSRFEITELRKKITPPVHDNPQDELTIDYAHVTDSANFMLALLECPPDLRGFIDALIGIGGSRTITPDWFNATDERIARRASRCEKWVQLKRKQLIGWQTKNHVALIDIEDNDYRGGEKVPHKYRINIARLAAESTLDARVSEKWRRGRFDEALEETAQTLLDSLPEMPMHKKHKPSVRLDAVRSMTRDLKFALTKTQKAKRTNELTGNRIGLTPEMVETVTAIRGALEAIENACSSCRKHL